MLIQIVLLFSNFHNTMDTYMIYTGSLYYGYINAEVQERYKIWRSNTF